jgi:hypothetical protein
MKMMTSHFGPSFFLIALLIAEVETPAARAISAMGIPISRFN